MNLSQTDRVVLILDIQSRAIHGALTIFSQTAPPHLIWTQILEISHNPHAGNTRLIKEILSAVQDITEASLRYIHINLEQNHKKRPINTIHCVLSSPWIVSQAKSISLAFKDNTKITPKTVLDLLKNERSSLLAGGKGQWSVIEEKIYDVRLNGYAVKDWQGKMARTLETACVVSVAGTVMINRFRQACSMATENHNIFFHSSLVLQGIGLHTASPHLPVYALIHVQGELTDVAIMNTMACLFLGSYPIGIQTIIRRIAHGLNVNQKTAESALNIHNRNHIDPSHGDHIATVVKRVSQSWLGGFRTLLISGGVENILPKEIFVSAVNQEDFLLEIYKKEYSDIKVEHFPSQCFAERVTLESYLGHIPILECYAIALQDLDQK